MLESGCEDSVCEEILPELLNFGGICQNLGDHGGLRWTELESAAKPIVSFEFFVILLNARYCFRVHIKTFP